MVEKTSYLNEISTRIIYLAVIDNIEYYPLLLTTGRCATNIWLTNRPRVPVIVKTTKTEEYETSLLFIDYSKNIFHVFSSASIYSGYMKCFCVAMDKLLLDLV